MYEVFDPKNGKPIVTTRQRWFAKFLAKKIRGLDWELAGQGWV